MSIMVKCPVCSEKIKLQDKPHYFFRHCGMAHPVEPNLIVYGYNPKTDKEKISEVVKTGDDSGGNSSEEVDIED